MAKTTYITQAVEISVWDGSNAMIISPEMLGDVKFKEEAGKTSIPTQGGEFSLPNGRDKATLSIDVYLPDITWADFLRKKAYTKATDSNGGGQFVSKAGGCSGGSEGFVVHVHPTCETFDINDIHLYNAVPTIDGEITFNDKGDAVKTTIVFEALPGSDGVRYMKGRSDVAAKKKYQASTNTWVAAD